MYRMNIQCAKDEPLSRAELAQIVQQQSEPHHKRPEEITEAAMLLAREMGIPISAGSDAGEDKPAAAPGEREEKAPAATTIPAPDPTPPVPQEEAASVAASPALNWIEAGREAAKTIAVSILLAFQAFIFAMLAIRVLNDNEDSVHLQFWFAFVAAFLIESGGVMIVSRYKVPEGAGEWAKRDIESSINSWLIPVMLFQVLVDCAYIGLLGSYSDLAGRWLVAIAIPMGIFVYSHLYFKR